MRLAQKGFRPQELVGSSPELQRCLELAEIAAADSAPLFIYGESGTGKDLLARAIHRFQQRDDGGNLVILNAAAKPASLLYREILGPLHMHSAALYPQVPRHLMLSLGGTLYLDDICRIPPVTQGLLLKFLRHPRIVLPDGTETVWSGRIISATNLDPAQALREGRFRRDLYDLLSTSYLALPPLRQRDGDIAEIATATYSRILRDYGLPPQELSSRVLSQLSALPWPGNVRQLTNTLRRMALSPEALAGETPELPADIRAEARPAGTPGEILSFAEIERRAILAAIDRNDGSVPRASDELQLAASTIYRKLKSWKL